MGSSAPAAGLTRLWWALMLCSGIEVELGLMPTHGQLEPYSRAEEFVSLGFGV